MQEIFLRKNLKPKRQYNILWRSGFYLFYCNCGKRRKLLNIMGPIYACNPPALFVNLYDNSIHDNSMAATKGENLDPLRGTSVESTKDRKCLSSLYNFKINSRYSLSIFYTLMLIILYYNIIC